MVSKAESYEREFFDRTFRFVKQSLIPSETPDAFSSLNSAKVAIVADQEALQTVNGQHMVSLSANLLSRFCRSIDLIMPD